MAKSRLGLTRDQLSVFLKDHEQIIQFEKLFSTVDESSSDNSIVDIEIIAQYAQTIANMASDTNHLSVDYIDFAPSAPHADKDARVVWNALDDTLNLHHSGGVVQQVGQEAYIYGRNNTGSIITNGSTIGFAGVDGDFRIEFLDYIADGTYRSEYFLGVATQDIDSGDLGFVTTFGNVRDINTTGSAVSESWVIGDELYASTTTAGAFLKVSATEGEIFIRPIIEQQKYYGQFTRGTDQVAGSTNTAVAVVFDTTEVSNGISLGTPASRLVAANAGLYNFSVNFQVLSNSASAKNGYFWFRKNGVDIASSTTRLTLSANGEYSPVQNIDFISLAATDYIEVMFAVDDTNLWLDASAATAFSPAAPAVMVAVTQVQQ